LAGFARNAMVNAQYVTRTSGQKRLSEFAMNAILVPMEGVVLSVALLEFRMHIIVPNAHDWRRIEMVVPKL